MRKPELVCHMKRLDRREIVSWAVTQMRDQEGQHVISTNRAEAAFQAHEEVISMKVEVMETGLSETITDRSLSGATAPDQTADVRTMTTVEVTLGPETGAIATVTTTAEVVAMEDDVAVIATMTAEGITTGEPAIPMPTLEPILDLSLGPKDILNRDTDVMVTTARFLTAKLWRSRRLWGAARCRIWKT
jgi:membrane-bound lytic murein transglycosylase B